jgi:hypothetical protein
VLFLFKKYLFIFVIYAGFCQISFAGFYRNYQINNVHNDVKIQNIFWRSEYR